MTGTSTSGFRSAAPSEDLPLAAKVAFLSRKSAYAPAPTHVERVQTHMAWVFLTDRHAWKLKKPVRYDFLDFSTPAARHADGRREVELNRRLAPEVYLGVVPLRADAEGHLTLGGDSPGQSGERAVDWLVQMKRLPAEAALDKQIQADTLGDVPVRELAQRLTSFYRHVPAAEMSPQEYRERFERDIQADRAALLADRFQMPAGRIDRIADWLLRMLEDQPRIFDQRIRQSRVVEAHGDLRPQHVYTVEPVPVIIDCLEFNADFRILDPLDELSFFALECERLGAAWVGRRVRELYQDATGDEPPMQLLEFYTRRRALLRAKLAVWHTADDTVDHHGRWRRRAEWYLKRADPGSVAR